jgi:hypothetical protein
MATVGGRGVRLGAVACFAMLAALAAAGCGSSSVTPAIIYVTDSPAPATPLPSGVTPAPIVTPVSPVIDSVVISSNAPDNSWQVTFKKPVISGVSAAASTKMNDTITAQVNGYISAFTGGGLPAVASGDGPSTLSGDFTIALDSPTLISLRFSVLTYVTGAAHPTSAPGSLNFVVSSGAKINLADIFSNPTAALTTIASQSHAALTTLLGSDLIWSGSASSLSFFDKAWAMTPFGLEFTWAQGDIASEASGMPSATLAWSAIKSLIKTDGPAGEFVG